MTAAEHWPDLSRPFIAMPERLKPQPSRARVRSTKPALMTGRV